MFHKAAPKMRSSFVELEIHLGKAGQFNLEALCHSVGDDGGEIHTEFKDTEFPSLTGTCRSYGGIKPITASLVHKQPNNLH